MARRSLRNTALIAVGVLVLSACLLTALVSSQRYAQSLEETLLAQSQSLALQLARQLAELVLLHDLTSVQKVLDRQFGRDVNAGYAFVVHDEKVLVHSFERAVPPELLAVHNASLGDSTQWRKIRFSNGRTYIDIATPIFEGQAGFLRIGFCEDPIRSQITRLWLETGGLTLAILVLALLCGAIFFRRLARPLAELVQNIQAVGAGNLAARMTMGGQSEVDLLATAFNTMSETLQYNALQLEEQAEALRRSHDQMRLCSELVTHAAAMNNLQDMALYLLAQVRTMLAGPLALLFLDRDMGLVIIAHGTHYAENLDHDVLAQALSVLEGQEHAFQTRAVRLQPPLVPTELAETTPQTIIPIIYNHLLCGALVTGNTKKFDSTQREMDIVAMLLTQVAGSVRRALHHEEEVRALRQRLDQVQSFHGLIGNDPKMQEIYKRIQDVAASDATILITGESGTGKELVAHAIHNASPRRNAPFIVINCAAYPESLLESELFGYEKGAFTGALRQKSGRFEQADGGTVFLDEIGEIQPAAQVKLLRVLQTRQFERVGGEKSVSVDVRVLAATHRDLLAEVQAGTFREDLYYRLDVIGIHLPPLRERAQDIPLLVHHFRRRWALCHQGSAPEFSTSTMRLLMDYAWPGNVRELENILEQSSVLARDTVITPQDLPPRLYKKATTIECTLEAQEDHLIRTTLTACGGNKRLAAERLGIGRTTLYAKMQRYGIEKQ